MKNIENAFFVFKIHQIAIISGELRHVINSTIGDARQKQLK